MELELGTKEREIEMYSERGAVERGCQSSGKTVGRVCSTPHALGVWLLSWLRAQSRFRVKIMALTMRNSTMWQEWSSEVTPQ